MTIQMTISAFSTAATAADYRKAKQHAARLTPADQFAIVDAIIAARRRLEAAGINPAR